MAWQTLDQQYKEQNTQNDRSNYLKDIIAGLSIAKNNDPMTLLGYALGRFGSNYVNRGLERRQQEKNTKGYDEWMQGVNKSAADAIPTVQGKAIPSQQNQNQQQLDILKGPSFVPEDVAREMTAGTPALQSAVNMQNAAPNTSPQISEIANQILGGQRQYAQNYDMTSDEVYNNAYRIARQNGSTETQARQFAQQKAAEYQPQRVNALSNAFIGNGVNPDGTINNKGVAMLAQLALEDPQQTNLLGNMYQTPQGATKFAQDIARQTLGSDLSLRNAEKMAGVNFGYQQRGADAQIQRQKALYDYKAQLDEAVRQGRQGEAYQMAFNLSKMGGASDQEAQIQALGYVLGGGRNSGGNSNQNDAKADKDHFARLDKWLERYGKEYRDPVTGEWIEGRGPGDPEYDERLEQYDRYTAKQYDTDDYEDAIKITQSLIDRGYPAEGISQYVDVNFGDLAPYIKRDLNLK